MRAVESRAELRPLLRDLLTSTLYSKGVPVSLSTRFALGPFSKAELRLFAPMAAWLVADRGGEYVATVGLLPTLPGKYIVLEHRAGRQKHDFACSEWRRLGQGKWEFVFGVIEHENAAS